MSSLGEPPPARHHPYKRREKSGNRERRDDEPAPDCRGSQRQSPSHDQCEERGRRRQRPPQVIQHLPATDQGNRGSMLIAAGIRSTAEDPWQQLPIAARPSMLASCRGVVARGELFDYLNIGCQPGSREDSLQQIVAEDSAFGEPAGERCLEGVYIINSLAAV